MRCALISIACSTAAAEPATSGTPAQGIAFTDWRLTCYGGTEKQRCSLSQTVDDAKGRRIIELAAKRAGPAAYLELRVPIGISIPFGVSLDLSDTLKLQTQLVDCDRDGCLSVLALNDKNLPQIKTAKTLAVTFQDSKSGKVISISGSAKGFEQGIAMVLAAP